jgi:hypothetical protein
MTFPEGSDAAFFSCQNPSNKIDEISTKNSDLKKIWYMDNQKEILVLKPLEGLAVYDTF